MCVLLSLITLFASSLLSTANKYYSVNVNLLIIEKGENGYDK